LALASSYEAMGQPDKAMETVKEALATYPNSTFAAQLKTRLSSARRALTPDGGAAVAVGSPANPQAAPATTAAAAAVPAKGTPPAPAAPARPAAGLPAQ
jgi:hypothetical protein